ncbi:hypothetical protein NtRootA4_36980 [Arthrobacter sp. NtRootA4]|nr:hypothetical protein NtRootA2_39190 [Arthrobacter sp. NtRootA2]BCW16719.1 hypothetical protein NtRootA4_36980 [Arthrobacter sp. NtRootA4]BCW25052.1 hypothetical protein NtRootC7_39190 [Arthrobacter sp. NtRootC7]BCW29321.1 hypothetical protein NtRootC45_39210 [Arthrobacter sp. NtRootC45]BCW33592.1 hypothetical protein NtRootD5_39230 [Arthrobacter sp. NtRootD5]
MEAIGEAELGWGHFGGSSSDAASGPREGQSSDGAFSDELAFVLGEGGEYSEDELPCGCGGVDCRALAREDL